MGYLRREIDAKGLLNTASDDDEKLEARICLGLDLAFSGKADQATEHLRWVKDHADPTGVGYALGLSALEKLERQNTRRAVP
jgi:hypothetical protein